VLATMQELQAASASRQRCLTLDLHGQLERDSCRVHPRGLVRHRAGTRYRDQARACNAKRNRRRTERKTPANTPREHVVTTSVDPDQVMRAGMAAAGPKMQNFTARSLSSGG